MDLPRWGADIVLYARFVWEELLLCHNWYKLHPIMQDFVEKMNIVCAFVGMAFLLMDLNSGNLNVICLINRLIATNRENFDETDISECV